MEVLSKPTFSFIFRNYFSLTKPGIIFGNIVNFLAGFLLASKGETNFQLLITALIGLSLIIASGCAFNNYIDRELDKKMLRTKNRVLARGVLSHKNALIFATILMLIGSYVLITFTNFLAFTISLFGLFVYVVIYTFMKYRSSYGTLIGSIAGATPPVVGYCAVSHKIDAGAIILFTMIAIWQMPHFFAIAIYRLEDFKMGSIPILPIKKSIYATKVQIVLYVVAFMIASSMLTLFDYAGYACLTIISSLGFIWLWLCIKGFKCSNDQLWASKVFRFSLIIVLTLCTVISL